MRHEGLVNSLQGLESSTCIRQSNLSRDNMTKTLIVAAFAVFAFNAQAASHAAAAPAASAAPAKKAEAKADAKAAPKAAAKAASAASK
jgi:hypothetical protein